MAKFIYRMQNILDIKYKLEEQAKIAYMQAQKKYNDELALLKALTKKKSDYEQELRDCMVFTIDIQKVKELESAIDVLEEKIIEKKKDVFKAYKRMMAARDKLNELMVDRKTHEKLKENAFEEFVLELNAAEMKEIDELVSFKFNKTDSEDS